VIKYLPSPAQTLKVNWHAAKEYFYGALLSLSRI
jgi:hypothetical protein